MVLEKIILGVSLAAPIGPVSAEMIKRGLKNGFWAAFNVRLGGAIGNSVCLVAAFFGLSALAQYKVAFSVVGVAGAILLLYMGIMTILKVFKNISMTESKEAFLSNSLLLGFVLAIANPIAIAFWLGIGAAGLSSQASPEGNIIVELGTFFHNFLIIAGVLLWGFALSLSLEFGRRIVTNKMLNIVTFISGTILLYFGCKYGFNGAKNLVDLLM